MAVKLDGSWLKRLANNAYPRSKCGYCILLAATLTTSLVVAIIVLWSELDGVLTIHPHVPELSVWPQPPSNPVPLPSLTVVLLISKDTDLTFYRNMWVGEHWFTICESNVPGCSMVCGSEPDWTTANAGVDCLVRAVKDRFSDTEFIVRLSDDMLVDRNYVYDVMRKHQKSGQPLYITSPALDSSQSGKQPVNTRTSGFYMFNRALAKCLSNRNSSSNQTASFEERVVAGCGESAQRLKEDSSKIWLKTYASKNKIIDLAI